MQVKAQVAELRLKNAEVSERLGKVEKLLEGILKGERGEDKMDFFIALIVAATVGGLRSCSNSSGIHNSSRNSRQAYTSQSVSRFARD